MTCVVCLSRPSQCPRWWHDDAKEIPHSVDLACLKRWLLACKQAAKAPLCPICFREVKVIHEEEGEKTITTRISELAASVIERRREKIVLISLSRQTDNFDALEEVIRNLSPPTGFSKTDRRMSRELLKVSRMLILGGHLEAAQFLARTDCLAPDDALKVMEFVIVRLKNEELALMLWGSVNHYINPDRVLMDAIHNDLWALAQRIIREKPIQKMSQWETLVFAAAANRREIIDLLLRDESFSFPRWMWGLAESRARHKGFFDLAEFLEKQRDVFCAPVLQ